MDVADKPVIVILALRPSSISESVRISLNSAINGS